MAEGDFNQIPPKCVGICELEQEDVDRHGIVLALNCKGPSLAGDMFKDSAKVRDGEVVAIDEVEGSSAGRVACTNAGVHLWLKDRKEAFIKGEA